MLAGPSEKMNPSSKQLSLEVLEQLSLTRQEWIEYFKSKKTPERLRNEINQLQGGTSVSDSCILTDQNQDQSRPNPKPRRLTGENMFAVHDTTFSECQLFDHVTKNSEILLASPNQTYANTGVDYPNPFNCSTHESGVIRAILDEIENARIQLETYLLPVMTSS